MFAATHGRMLSMVAAGLIDGVRVDHPDGLADPTGYLERLRHEIGDRWLVVEKILGRDESLPESWPVDGTTGYEQSAALDRLFVVPSAEAPMTVLAMAAWTAADGEGAAGTLEEIVLAGEHDALAQLFETELRRLTGLGVLVAHQLDDGNDRSLHESTVRLALASLAIACPVYRTYVRPASPADDRDRQVLDDMFARAEAMLSGDLDAVGALRSFRPVFDRATRTEAEESFVVRLQQLTAAVTAKGVEDTAFYRLPRLVSACEVGADPLQWSIDVDEFHARRRHAAAVAPLGMVATSTHDSKRSADARARLTALTEVPERWTEVVSAVNARLDDLLGPDRRDPVLDLQLLQLVLAAHPAGVDRLAPVAIKAAREAKRRTSWLRPVESYEADVEETIRVLVSDPDCRRVLDPLLDDLIVRGRWTSLSSLLLALAGPGVPDLYQASLGWRTTLADPDNRADPDVSTERELLRRATVAGGTSSWTAAAIAADDLGVAKAHLVRTALGVRRAHAACFAPGSTYTPLAVTGRGAAHRGRAHDVAGGRRAGDRRRGGAMVDGAQGVRRMG